jgi:hypothetical protein
MELSDEANKMAWNSDWTAAGGRLPEQSARLDTS